MVEIYHFFHNIHERISQEKKEQNELSIKMNIPLFETLHILQRKCFV
jgi:predicted HTH domain antitoxin